MNPDFWRGRRVFVTGHTGFKGGWLSLWLQHLGAEVGGYALAAPTEPNLFGLARVGDGMDSCLGDIRDATALADALAARRPEIVFHLAAQPLVRAGYADPLGTWSSNVIGTANLLEAVRRCGGVRAVINVTSDKCYENREWPWGYRENDALGGADPYSSSKACAELVGGAWRAAYFPPERHAQHGLALASARAGNVIGGGDWATDRLVPDIVAAFLARRPAKIRNPHAVRPWQHVLDALSGYLVLAEKLVESGPDYGEPWNFGPLEDQSRPVAWLVEAMADRWGTGATWRSDDAPQPHETAVLRLDSAKALIRLGWQPRCPLGRAIDATVDWYRAWAAGDDMAALTRAQIEAWTASDNDSAGIRAVTPARSQDGTGTP